MKKFFLGLLLVIVLIGGVLVWQRSRLPEWIARQIKATVNNEFLKGTKAELKDLRFEADLWSFLFGKDGKLSFQLNFGDFVVRGQGTIKIHLAADKIQFQYGPEVSLRTLSTDVAILEPAITVAIAGNIPTARPAESALAFQIDSTTVNAPQFFVAGDFSGQATASTKDVQAQFQGKKFSLKLPTKDLVECSDFETRLWAQGALLSAEIRCREILAQTGDEATMLLLKNQRVEIDLDSEKMRGDVRLLFGDVEALVGPVMFQTDRFKAEVLRFQFEVQPDVTTGLLQWGPLRVNVQSKLVAPYSAHLDWRLKSLNLNPILDPVIEEVFKKQFKASNARIEGAGVFSFVGDLAIPSLLRHALSRVKLKLSLDVESPKAQWRALGIGIDVQSVKREIGAGDGGSIGLLADLKVDDFGWRGVGGRLYPSQFQIQVVPGKEMSQLKGTAVGELKVAMKEIDARIAPIKALLNAAETASQSFIERLHVLTALHASTESVASLFEKVCLPWPTQWKTALTVDWKEIELKGGNLKLDGESKVEVIGGKITTGPVAIENILSNARITRFSTWIRGLQLRDLGAPINFGEMDGVLKGDLEDVEMLGFVPRRYRARFELLPNEKKEVVFSAVAMKNFVSLFTPEDFSGNIPGPIREIAFGWLSRVLGGYNIKYAGLSLTAIDDSILLETLDPEANVKRDGQRYLLYGTRFKIPLKSSRYPVVLDAPGLTNFVLHVQSVLSELSKKAKPSENEATKGDNDVSKDYCNPDSSNAH